MGFKIEHGKISTLAPIAYGAGQASYKRLLEQQAFQAGMQERSQSFQAKNTERAAQLQADRDFRLADIDNVKAEAGFERQKELIDIQRDYRNEDKIFDRQQDVQRADELAKLNETRRREADKYQYETNKERRLNELNKFRAQLDGLVGDNRYDPVDVAQARLQIEAEEANIHRNAVPKPKPDPEAEIAQSVAQIDQGDGTAKTYERQKDGTWRVQKSDETNRAAVAGKMMADATKSLEGRLDENDKPIPATEEEIYNRSMMFMRIRDRMLGKPEPPAPEPPPPPPPRTPEERQEQLKQSIARLHPEQQAQLKEEKDRIIERLTWAKNSGAHIEYARAKEELKALLESVVNPPRGVPPPMEQ